MKNEVLEYKIYNKEENRHYIESLSELQSNINLASFTKEYKGIAVSSANEAEGKSTLSANLANLYALKGKKTLVVNLDLRKPTSHYFFKVPREVGVVEYCGGEATIDQIIKHSEFGVDVITSGKKTMFASEIIASDKLVNLFKELREKYDYIIVDTAPIIDINDTLLAKNCYDGLGLVIRQNKTKLSPVKEAVKKINENNIDLLGSVLVGVKHKGRYYYYYSEK